jgi:membrane fusion protein (multidrug efflux system)
MESRSKNRTALLAAAGGAVVVLVVGAIAGVKVMQISTITETFAAQVPPAERVNAVAVEQQHWEARVASVGSVVAVQGTQVSTEADGVVRAIAFQAGSVVAAGAELVRLDDEVEQAQLRSAEAALQLANLTFERAQRLIAQRAISQSDLEQADATWRQARAQVDNIRAVIAKKVVRAPFAGRVGIRRVSVGDYLAQGTQVVSLQSLDPVYVEFSVPQQRLGQMRDGLAVLATVDSYPGEEFGGSITAIEPHVNSATRNVRIQATFANGHGALKPGMFVSVDVALGAAQPVHVIPATAVVHEPHGDSVFVIEPAPEPQGTDALVLRQQPVKLGARRGDFVVVENGALAGDRVVATGVFKLRAGAHVIIDNTLKPDFALAPAPNNG